jgi:hypothetical protein
MTRQEIIEIINAASGVATFGTLIYLLIKDWINRKQITDLSVIVVEIKHQNGELRTQNELFQRQIRDKSNAIWELSKPILSREKFNLEILNVGKQVYVTEIEYQSDTIIFTEDEDRLPKIIEHERALSFYGILKEELRSKKRFFSESTAYEDYQHIRESAFNESFYKINFEYKDVNGFKYKVTINGKGEQIPTIDLIYL